MADRPDLATLWPLEPVDMLPADAVPAAVVHFAALQARAAARLALPAEATPAAGQNLLTVPGVAARLGVPPQYVYELIRKGDLPGIRFGKYVRVDPADLTAWIAQQKGVIANGPARWQTAHHGQRRVQGAPAAPPGDAGAARASARGHDIRRLPVGGRLPSDT